MSQLGAQMSGQSAEGGTTRASGSPAPCPHKGTARSLKEIESEGETGSLVVGHPRWMSHKETGADIDTAGVMQLSTLSMKVLQADSQETVQPGLPHDL